MSPWQHLCVMRNEAEEWVTVTTWWKRARSFKTMYGQTKDWIIQTIQKEHLTFSNALIYWSLKLVSIKTYHRLIRSSAWFNYVQGNRADGESDNNFRVCLSVKLLTTTKKGRERRRGGDRMCWIITLKEVKKKKVQREKGGFLNWWSEARCLEAILMVLIILMSEFEVGATASCLYPAEYIISLIKYISPRL